MFSDGSGYILVMGVVINVRRRKSRWTRWRMILSFAAWRLTFSQTWPFRA